LGDDSKSLPPYASGCQTLVNGSGNAAADGRKARAVFGSAGFFLVRCGHSSLRYLAARIIVTY
jgi:hypothetical protein